jgi:hypothetical protein
MPGHCPDALLGLGYDFRQSLRPIELTTDLRKADEVSLHVGTSEEPREPVLPEVLMLLSNRSVAIYTLRSWVLRDRHCVTFPSDAWKRGLDGRRV